MEEVYKIATRYDYSDEKNIVNPGCVFKKGDTPNYDTIEGIEVDLEDIGNLYIAVDEMLYDISNQWEQGIDIYELTQGVLDAMVTINKNS